MAEQSKTVQVGTGYSGKKRYYTLKPREQRKNVTCWDEELALDYCIDVAGLEAFLKAHKSSPNTACIQLNRLNASAIKGTLVEMASWNKKVCK